MSCLAKRQYAVVEQTWNPQSYNRPEDAFLEKYGRLSLWSRKSNVECCKWYLKSGPSKNLKCCIAESHVDFSAPAQEVSEDHIINNEAKE